MKALDQPSQTPAAEPLRAPSLTITHEKHLDELQLIPEVVGLKRILVPIDFSELSIEALKYALPLARKFKAKITLLHIIEVLPFIPPYGIAGPPAPDGELIETREKQLEALAQQKVGPAFLEKTVVHTGEPCGSIVHYASQWNYDLIILTTHGTTGLRHLFMGSTAEKVVRHAQCPVLVVHSRKVEDEEQAPRADLYGHEL